MNADHKPIIEKIWNLVQAALPEGVECGDLWSEEPGRLYRSLLPQRAKNGDGRIPAIDAWVDRFPVTFVLASDGANPSFSPAEQTIRMVPLCEFKSASTYYSTLFHELSHWSGMKLGRPAFKQERPSDAQIVFEEIIADIASVIVGDYWNIGGVDINASYIRSFLDRLPAQIDRGKSFYFCSLLASRTADFLMNDSRP
jgi:antirestriction protein ArdC